MSSYTFRRACVGCGDETGGGEFVCCDCIKKRNAELSTLRAENEVLKKERDELAAALDYWTRIVDELQCILPEVGGEPAAIAVRAALDAYVSDREAAVEAILATHDKAKDRKIAELTAAWKASVPRGKIPAPWEDRLDAILDARDAKIRHESSQATMEWALKAMELAILHPADLDRADGDVMQSWKDLREVLKRVLPIHDAVLVKPLVEALLDACKQMEIIAVCIPNSSSGQACAYSAARGRSALALYKTCPACKGT